GRPREERERRQNVEVMAHPVAPWRARGDLHDDRKEEPHREEKERAGVVEAPLDEELHEKRKPEKGERELQERSVDADHHEREVPRHLARGSVMAHIEHDFVEGMVSEGNDSLAKMSERVRPVVRPE